MTVSTATSRNDYTGNGILLTFPYTFRIFADADLNVLVAGVPKTLTTDYTVTGAGNTGGGNVVFVSAPTGAVAIVRNVSAKQDVDLVENDPFSAETVEAALDRAEMLIQQLQEIIGRSLAVATSSTQKNLVVDDLVAGKFLQVKTPATAGLQMVDVTASGSIGIPVSIAQGGTGQITAQAALTALAGVDIQTAWTSYVPTVTAASGTFTAASATGRYKQLGKTVFIQMYLLISTVGTGGFPQISLPTPCKSGTSYSISGFHFDTGEGLVGWIGNPDTSKCLVRLYNGSDPAATSHQYFLTGVYEAN